MAVNSPQPTLLCVIIFCVFLSILYDQDVPFLDFVVLFVFVVVVAVVAAFIVIMNHLLGIYWSVLIPLGTIICLTARGAGVVGVSRLRLLPLILWSFRRAHSCGESPIWKVLVCRNPSGHHYLPFQREEKALVECTLQSFPSVTLPSFSLSPLSRSYLSGIVIWDNMGRSQSLLALSYAYPQEDREWFELS